LKTTIAILILLLHIPAFIYAGELNRTIPNQFPTAANDSTEIQRSIVRQLHERFGLVRLAVERNGIIGAIDGRKVGYDLKGADRIERISNFFNANRDIFGIADPKSEFTIRLTDSDSLGNSLFWCGQQYNGIQIVVGGYMDQVQAGYQISAIADSNFITSVKGVYYPSSRRVDTNPSISYEQARDIAANDSKYAGNSIIQSKPELFIACYGDDCRLAWRIGVNTSQAEGPVRYIIDAHTGEILQAQPASKF
jgi:Zn-dependent metalloprotease